MADTADYRLPQIARPERYELEFRPDLELSAFEGTETVTVSVLKPTADLVLNSLDLDVSAVRLKTPSGRDLDGSVSYDSERQQVIVSFAETLPPGDGYRLSLSFRGVLNERLKGFYRSTFTGADGGVRVIGLTQFESTDARRAFPCWDEPAFKAVFSITLVVADGLAALSNGAELSSEDAGGGRRRVRFADTMAMSTYLVAFVVGPFEMSSSRDVDGVPLRIAAVPGKSSLTGFAADAGEHSLRFLSRYFEIPYPGDKIDHVGVPDFLFGAMENLGCVTYRESVLLADPARASQLELQRIATVVAHETAHMWFGDLVTMKWWNGIWLNEAFATFMELLTTDDFKPEWQVWNGFAAAKAAAMVTDGLRATRPVEFSVGRPEEAEAMFDLLTYQKGGAVLRMLEQYLSPETFRKGIGHYLRSHAHGNTETSDLWDALETVSGEPVRSIMDSWIMQGGHPIVTVESGEGGSSLVLTQQRFLYSGETTSDSWAVPVNLRASVGGSLQHQRVLLSGESAEVSFDGPIDWVIVNDGGWGFYRVRYSPALRGRLARAGIRSVATPLERFNLVSDTWAAAVAGLVDVRDWAAVARATAGDADPDVWAGISGIIALLDAVSAGGPDGADRSDSSDSSGSSDSSDSSAVARFASELAAPVWDRLGWDAQPGEAARTGTARARVLAVLGLAGHDPQIRSEASERMSRHLSGIEELAPDVVAAALAVVIGSGGEEEWSNVFERYRSAELPQEKLRYLFALPYTRRPDLIARTLDLALDPQVRSQDAPLLVAGVLGHPYGARQAWDWIEANWAAIVDRFPQNLLVRILEALTGVADPGIARSVGEFLAGRDIPVTGPRLDQILERLQTNVALAARLRGGLTRALEA